MGVIPMMMTSSPGMCAGIYLSRCNMLRTGGPTPDKCMCCARCRARTCPTTPTRPAQSPALRTWLRSWASRTPMAVSAMSFTVGMSLLRRQRAARMGRSSRAGRGPGGWRGMGGRARFAAVQNAADSAVPRLWAQAAARSTGGGGEGPPEAQRHVLVLQRDDGAAQPGHALDELDVEGQPSHSMLHSWQGGRSGGRLSRPKP
jgi:hypothetical protein